MKNYKTALFVLLVVSVVGCTPMSPASEATLVPLTETVPAPTRTQIPTVLPTEIPTQEVSIMTNSIHADVLSVNVTGQANAFQFNVQVSSPDTGCDQYADWWEVLSEDGQLIYRRVLLHSHVNEQPFTRSGGPVGIDSDTVVILRAHMNEGGYGGTALRGTVSSGFEAIELESGFAADVELMPPLPEGCAF